MKKLVFVLSFAILPLITIAQKGSYVLKLVDVSQEGTSIGKIQLDSIKPSKLVIYVGNYSDSLINASFKWNQTSIEFELTNLSKKTIKVIWNDAAYINYNGITGKVMHTGIKYIDRNNDQPSSSIISEAKVSDLIIPTNNVYYRSGYYGGWETMPLLPSIGKKDPRPLVGKMVKVLLPILSDLKQVNYVFSFEIVFNEYK